MTACARKKVLLMILDGWGIGRGDRADVIGSVRPQRLGEFAAKYPHAELRTDGENVGLPDGQMGNSEVGHLNIGAGRVLYQDLVKINRAVADGSIGDNPEVKALIDYCRGLRPARHGPSLRRRRAQPQQPHVRVPAPCEGRGPREGLRARLP
ncbi:MAG: hypothetical protein ACLT0O_11515 [Sutterella wadsworthensis]